MFVSQVVKCVSCKLREPVFFIFDTATILDEPEWPVFTSAVKCVHMSRCFAYGCSDASFGAELNSCTRGVFVIMIIIIINILCVLI